MNKKPVVDFFLGALSPSGFTGFFRDAAEHPDVSTYLIKAGPGCGKSTFMRRLGDADLLHSGTGMVERIHCSSDPDSLDGVRLTDVGALVLDATAPHTIDCKYPGAESNVLSFYDTLELPYLAANREEILRLGDRNTGLLRLAAGRFAFACALLQQQHTLAEEYADFEKLRQCTKRLAHRTMPVRKDAPWARPLLRLLSAPTPGGLTVYQESVSALAETIYVLEDPLGALSNSMMEQLSEHALRNGYQAIQCYCSGDQHRMEHLIIPELSLAFVTSNLWHPLRYEGQITIRAGRFLRMKEIPRHTFRKQAALVEEFLQETYAYQAEAKAEHDKLERYYVHATDFAGVDAIRERLEATLFQ